MEEIAQVYARSLFEVAKERGRLDVVREQLGQVADAIEQSRDLAVFFFSPYFSTEEKKDGLARSIEGGDEALMNFIGLLVEKHRMPAIFRIRRRFDALWGEEHKLLPVQVRTAVPLDESTLEQLKQRIGEQTDRTVEFTSEVDPDILGGIVLRVGNQILDASIRSRLDHLRKEVAKA